MRTRRRWTRYAVTSLVATAVSESMLLGIYGAHLLGASVAAVVASMTAAVPSYAMSRYWIWPEADRRRPGRQAAGFWVVGLVSLGVSSLLTGVAAANAPPGRVAHVVVVGAAYVGTYGALWLLKFALYQRLLFRPAPHAPRGGPASPPGWPHLRPVGARALRAAPDPSEAAAAEVEPGRTAWPRP